MIPESKCSVSVVVPTYKRPALLARCLAALMAQDFDATAYEVIVADDAACDETRSEVETWSERMAKCGRTVRYVPVRGAHGPAAARNAGWRVASGEIIAFTDDDCVPSPGWLRAGVTAFHDGVLAVAGRLVVPLPVDHRPTDYEMNASHLETARFITANCFYRRFCLAVIGGFDERFTLAWREDSDLIFTLLEWLAWRSQGGTSPLTGRSFWQTAWERVPRRGGGGGEGWWGPLWPPVRRWAKVARPKKPIREEGTWRPQGSPDDSLVESAFVYAPDAVVVHPLRPAPWGVSLRQQRKSMFNALLYKKHPHLYRERIQATPPWHYYRIVGALLALLVGIASKNKPVMLAAGGLWLWLTSRFCAKRLRGTSRKPGHVAEMVVTSMLIPPLSVFWRISGAVKFRVWFL